MKVICQGRATGKTSRLIVLSGTNNIPIMVQDKKGKDYIEKLAKLRDINIPEPIIYDKNADYSRKAYYVDNAEYLLQYILGCNLKGISINSEDVYM